MDFGLGVRKARSVCSGGSIQYASYGIAGHLPHIIKVVNSSQTDWRDKYGFASLSDRKTEGISMCLTVCEHAAGAEAKLRL